MSKYFVYDNANRRIRVGDHSFAFDIVGNFAGAWRGVLKLDDAPAIAALESIASRFGIREISAEEYDEFQKKKSSSSSASGSITPVHQPQTNLANRGAGVVVSEGRVVKSFGNPPTEAGAPPVVLVEKKTVEEVIDLGTAQFNDPLDVKLNEKAPKKKK